MQADGFRELLGRAQAGDQAAAGEMLVRVWPFVRQQSRLSYDPLSPADGPSDIAQEATVKIWQSLHQFEGGADDAQTFALFRAWVGRIVRNHAANAARNGRRKRRMPTQPVISFQAAGVDPDEGDCPRREPVDGELTPAAQFAHDEEEQRVREALDAIPAPLDRQIVWERFYLDRSLREIADDLGLSYDRIRQGYLAGMKQLEQHLMSSR